MHCGPVLLPGAEHDQVACVIAGRAENEPGNPTAAVPVSDAGGHHDPAHARRVEHPAFYRLPPCHHRRCFEGRLLSYVEIVPEDPFAADMEVGLSGAREGVGGRVDYRGVEVRAGSVAGTSRVDGAVSAAELARERGPVVEVEHLRYGPDSCHFLRLGLVAHECGHLVAVLLQFG